MSSGQNIPITVVGDIVGTVANGLSISGSAITTYNITGNIGAVGATNYCLICQNGNAVFNITGNVFGSNISASGSAIRESPGTFVINGNVTAGRSGHGVDKNSSGNITINGNVSGWPLS